MDSTLETAIDKIRSVGERICENQVYCFDDYEFDPETRMGDATILCTRLGIPVTDDVVIEYAANRTFSPLPEPDIDAYEDALGASLPDDYKQLLATFGAFHLPGSAAICLASPTSAISSTCDGWWFDDPLTMTVLAISSYHQHSDGDSIGFVRDRDRFNPALFVFKHELRSGGDDPSLWTEHIADSFAAFVIAYIDGL